MATGYNEDLMVVLQCPPLRKAPRPVHRTYGSYGDHELFTEFILLDNCALLLEDPQNEDLLKQVQEGLELWKTKREKFYVYHL